MEEFYDYLASIGIVEPPDANEIIYKMSASEAVKVLENCFMLFDTGDNREALPESMFNYIASNSLSGDIYPCSEWSCRIDSAYRLSLFTALYADRIVIPNLFDYFYGHEFSFESSKQITAFYERLIGGIMVYVYYRPLILAGYMRVVCTLNLVCADCKLRHIQEQDEYMAVIQRAVDLVYEDLLENIKFSLKDKTLYIDDPKGFVSSGAVSFIKMPRELRPYRSGSEHLFSRDEVEKLQLLEIVVTPAVDDLLMQRYYLSDVKASLITDRRLDTSIIERTNISANEGNPILPSALQHTIPFIDSVPLLNLIELRKNEENAFNRYRDAFTTVIQQAGGETNAHHIEEAVKEMILPEVNNIEGLISKHKSKLQKRALKQVAYSGAIFTAGYIGSHFLNISNIPADIASGFASKDIAGNLIESQEHPDEAVANSYYFLWKAAKLAHNG